MLLAAAHVEQNRFDDAEHVAEVEDEAQAGPDAASYAVQRGYILGIGLGRLDDAPELLGRAGPACRGPLVAALAWAGRYGDVEAMVRPLYETAVADHDEFLRGSAANELGAVALESGRPADARRWLLEALAPLARSDPYGFLATAHSRVALAEALCGDAGAARRAVSCAGDEVRGQLRWHELELCRAEVWTLAAEGPRRRPPPLHRPRCLHELVAQPELPAPRRRPSGRHHPGALEALTGLTEGFEGSRFAAIGAHARGVAARDPHPGTRGPAPRRGRRRAHPRRRHPDLHTVDPPRGTDRHPRSWRPIRPRDRPAPLLSVRTGENHLYHAYAKLGVPGRTSLKSDPPTRADPPDA